MGESRNKQTNYFYSVHCSPYIWQKLGLFVLSNKWKGAGQLNKCAQFA